MMDADDPEWIKGFTEVGLRGLWQDRGFFFANVTSEARSLSRSSSIERFVVTAHVTEGLQYRLRGVRFVGDETNIPESRLRKAIPLADGDLFNVSRIREGLDSLTKLYVPLGYLDFTAVPVTEPDDDLRQISVVFNLDLQRQFRVSNVEILTVNPNVEQRLRSLVRPGDVLNPVAVEEFMKQNRSALPAGVSFSHDVYILRNQRTGIVDLNFDFRVCQ